MIEPFEMADVARPQNVTRQRLSHARWVTARSLLARMPGASRSATASVGTSTTSAAGGWRSGKLHNWACSSVNGTEKETAMFTKRSTSGFAGVRCHNLVHARYMRTRTMITREAERCYGYGSAYPIAVRETATWLTRERWLRLPPGWRPDAGSSPGAARPSGRRAASEHWLHCARPGRR